MHEQTQSIDGGRANEHGEAPSTPAGPYGRHRSDVESKVRRLDLDVRGILAILSLMSSFALAFTQLILKGTAEIPAWTASVATGVVGFYFGSRGGTNGKSS